MSFEITTAFVQQYGSNVEMLAQQRGSRLRNAVTLETNVVGKSAFFDQVGEVAAQRVTNRHGDSPLNPTPHARRRVSMFDYDTGDLIDDFDKIKTLIDPSNPYAMAHGAAMGRGMDDEIIAAYFGTAYTGEDGSSTVSFPATQQIAVNNHDFDDGTGNVGLTVGKLIAAKVTLWGAEAMEPDEPMYIAVTGQQLGDLLQDPEVTSADYNTVRALVQGDINSYMGFEFIRTERLLVDSNSYRRCPVWTRSGMKLGIGKDITSRITERPDKRFSTYAYFCMSIGATRMQEDKVVEIKCAE